MAIQWSFEWRLVKSRYRWSGVDVWAGQGTWYALTHRPDKIIAAAPVSGYSSIQSKFASSAYYLSLTIAAYVPYQFWHEADPLITSVLQASMNSYRHELLVDNFNGIPVLQQHGSADDNVPVYHSRHMNQLISVSTGSSKYVELSGVGHWFDGVMTTMPLREFYEHWLDRKQAALELPMRFTIVVANPGDMGSRAGIVVDQLVSPGQFGRIHVERFPLSTSWVLRTSNILRFHFIRHCGFRLRIDNTPEFEVCEQKREDWGDFTRLKNGSWQVGSNAAPSYAALLTWYRDRISLTGQL